jgi:hypothetical protein
MVMVMSDHMVMVMSDQENAYLVVLLSTVISCHVTTSRGLRILPEDQLNIRGMC